MLLCTALRTGSVCGTGDSVPQELKQQMDGAAIAIWTTTPWTMPANMAVAVNGKLEYALVQTEVRCLAQAHFVSNSMIHTSYGPPRCGRCPRTWWRRPAASCSARSCRGAGVGSQRCLNLTLAHSVKCCES